METFQRLKNFAYRTLRWSEQYTKTDMVYLAKGGFWLTLGQGISALASFGTAIAFANLLPQETYGTYKFVLSVIGILTIPTLQGMGTAVTRAVAQGFEKTMIPAFKAKIKWGSLSAIASLMVAGYYWYNSNSTLTLAFLIAAIFLPFMDSFSIYESYLVGKKEFGKGSRYGIFIKIISFVSLILSIWLSDNIYLILLAYFVPYTILRMIFYFYTIKSIQKDSQIQSEAIGYGKHLSLMRIIEIMANQVDKILLFHYLGAIELAMYSIAIAPVEQLKGILKNSSSLVLPKFAEKNIKFEKSIIKKTVLFSVVLLLITIIYIVLSPVVFKIFFPNYINSIFYSQIFSLSLVSVVLFIPLSLMEARGSTKNLYQYKTISSIFTIISIFVFIYFYGLLGAVIGRLTARMFNLILATIYAKKIH